MKKVVFRVDSSTQIGSGHLMRCLTLAAQMKKQHGTEIHFICRDLEGNLTSLVEQERHILHVLPRASMEVSLTGYAAWLTVSWRRDAEETKALLLSIGQADLLVVDSYALDILWEKELRPLTTRIFVIDDLANRRHDCDILLDQNFYLHQERRYQGLVPETCELRLGPKYALLREEFYEMKKTPRLRGGNIRNILVFYGGSDLTNETMKALRSLATLSLRSVTVNVVVGGSNPYRREIQDFCRQQRNFFYFYQVNHIAALMNEADLSLGAGGTTIWERHFLGLPSIVTAIAENQVKVCEDCAQAGMIEYLGEAANVSERAITAAVRRHLNASAALVDV